MKATITSKRQIIHLPISHKYLLLMEAYEIVSIKLRGFQRDMNFLTSLEGAHCGIT